MANYQHRSVWIAGHRAAERRTRAGVFLGFGDTSDIMKIAQDGETVYLSRPMTVNRTIPNCAAIVASGPNPCGSSIYGPAGSFVCNGPTFGMEPNGRGYCWVRRSDVEFVGLPGNAKKVADQDQGFRADQPSVVYYGGPGGYVSRVVPPGSFMCNNANFGPDPAYGQQKNCYLVATPGAQGSVTGGAPITYYDEQAAQADAQDRAQAAAQAQRDTQAAEDAVIGAQSDADYAAQQAQIAQNAQAQAAAALAAAEAYRQIQEQAHRQAAEYAAQIAVLVAANASDADAAAAAANTTAQAVATAQALASAQSDQAQAQAAYDAASAAAQAELRNQERANANLQAAVNAADQYASNQAGGAGASAGMSRDLLLYGGLAALAVVLLLLAGD